MAAVTICSDFGAQEKKVCHCFHSFPILCLWRAVIKPLGRNLITTHSMISLTVLKSLGFLLGTHLYPLHLKRLVSHGGTFLPREICTLTRRTQRWGWNKDVEAVQLLASHHLAFACSDPGLWPRWNSCTANLGHRTRKRIFGVEKAWRQISVFFSFPQEQVSSFRVSVASNRNPL